MANVNNTNFTANAGWQVQVSAQQTRDITVNHSQIYPSLNAHQAIVNTQVNAMGDLRDRIITAIDKYNKTNLFTFQDKIDQLGESIKNKFKVFNDFNKWLDSNGQGDWYVKLATFLYKLPVRAVRNIIRLLYNILEAIAFSIVHPVKAAANLAKYIVLLIDELTKPATWSKIGAGMIGTGLGSALITGNPLSLIAIGVGGAMILGGVTFGALKAAIQSEKGERLSAVKRDLLHQLEPLPEVALTGFCMGLMVGGIQQALTNQTTQTTKTETVKGSFDSPGKPSSYDIAQISRNHPGLKVVASYHRYSYTAYSYYQNMIEYPSTSISTSQPFLHTAQVVGQVGLVAGAALSAASVKNEDSHTNDSQLSYIRMIPSIIALDDEEEWQTRLLQAN